MHQVRKLIFGLGLSFVQQRCRNKQFLINESGTLTLKQPQACVSYSKAVTMK
jgi:hypothetical protein